MKGLMKNKKFTSTLAMIALTCFSVLAPKAFGVTPPPDGCYPNYTTAEGCSALNALTSGAGNTGLGWYALYGNTTGNFNTGVGAGALVLNNGNSNTATGAAALLLNTSGAQNTAVGTDAMVYNDTGSGNTAVGAFSFFSNTTGSQNNAFGVRALYNHVTGSFNNAFGGLALDSDTSGTSNNAFGDGSLGSNISGSNNTAVGDLALNSSNGDYNTALGSGAGTDPGIVSNNIYIGDSGFPGDTNVISIGGIPASGTNYENTYIGGIYGATVQDRAVYVSSDGHLGTLMSSRRYKEEIKPMEKASEALFELKPVTFRYKQQIDPSHKLSYGLIAEEVAKISSDLVSPDKEGKPQAVRYEAVNAMLLNEFLKEHTKVQELESRLAQQEEQIESLTAGLQKVSARLETSRSATKVAISEP